VSSRNGLLVLVTDREGRSYLINSGHGLLPLERGRRTTIMERDIRKLPSTAFGVLAKGPAWAPASVELFWNGTTPQFHLFAWQIAALAPKTDESFD
jgi:hypothetical protein